jgi:hypothetical protein
MNDQIFVIFIWQMILDHVLNTVTIMLWTVYILAYLSLSLSSHVLSLSPFLFISLFSFILFLSLLLSLSLSLSLFLSKQLPLLDSNTNSISCMATQISLCFCFSWLGCSWPIWHGHIWVEILDFPSLAPHLTETPLHFSMTQPCPLVF